MKKPQLSFVVISIVLIMAVTALSCGQSRQLKHKGEPSVMSQTDSARSISIVFGGDVMAHTPQINAARRDTTFDFRETFKFIKPLFDTTDIVIVNLETTISQTGEYTGYPRFSAPRQLVEALKWSGVGVVMLANNHICDKGADGIKATTHALEAAGLEYTGAFADSVSYLKRHPLRLSSGGIDIAVFNYTYGTNGLPIPKGMVVNLIDTTRMAVDLASIGHEDLDHIVVFLHWGEEYSGIPSEDEKKLAEWCHAHGADIVVGNHPHVIRPLETTVDSAGRITGLTAYSLGNLVSNQTQRGTDGSIIVRLGITHRDNMPATMDPRYVLAWTHIYWDSLKHYDILPSYVADTLLKEATPSRKAYELFIDDSRAALGEKSGFREIGPQ